ncbi:MAG: chemotaxis protein CheW [Planctomycetota bacterium]
MGATVVSGDLGDRRPDDLELVVFEVGGQRHGVISTAVCEVLPAVTLTPVSGGSRLVEGVVNVRGSILPVVDVRVWLGLETRPMEPTDHMIVVRVGERSAMLRVDRAVELIRLARSEIEAANGLQSAAGGISGFAKLPDGPMPVHELESLLAEAVG